MRSTATNPGGEVVGVVTGIGADVPFAVGDRVGGVVLTDAYADEVLADHRLMSRVPPEADAADAVAVVRGGLVALGALRAGQVAPGDAVLVTAAASGVGHLALQIARAAGAARVVAAVGSADKARFARECGAGEVVTYDDRSCGQPVDGVLDGVGGGLVGRGLAAVRPLGRLVSFSVGVGTLTVDDLLGGARSVVGFTIGTVARHRPEVVEAYRVTLWGLLADGRLRPRTVPFPFERAAEAVELVAARRNLGRVVLVR